MKLKAVPAVMLILLLISTLTLASNIQTVKSDWTWTETIYIRADGSIEPDTAPISTVDNITYILTDNIVRDFPTEPSAITVERSNIIIDGNGYILQGFWTHAGTGIYLSGRSNVTIKNTQVTDFSLAIHAIYSSNLTLTGNNASDNWSGICCQNCSNVVLANNTASDNTYGIWLRWESNNNTIVDNNASKNYYGIAIETGSSDNICVGNNASTNEYGIRFYNAGNNIVYHNDFIDNTQPVYITPSSHDNVWDNGYPSGGNYWSDYTGVDEYSGPNQDQPGSDGIGDTQYTIDANNTDTYPLMGASHDIAVKNVVPSGTKVYEGEVVNINVTVKNEGTFSETFNVTTFYDSSVIQTQTDVALNSSIETTLTFSWNTSAAPGNHRILAEASIVSGETDTSDNIFVNGIVEVITKIDVPVEGENATVEGNVTITKAKVTKNNLHFDASGPSGSTGWINVTFPIVNTTDIRVFINNEKLTPPPFPIITTNGTHYFIYFEFPLSTHEIVIQFAPAHDVAVTNVTPSKTVVGQNYSMSINVTVQNQGDYNETFNVTAYYGNATITSQQWETFWSKGDVNRNGYINETDQNIISFAFDSRPGDPNWCPWADLNQDDYVDINDAMIYVVNSGLEIWTYFISGGVIETQPVNNLSPGNSTPLTFTWNTTDVPYGNYTISAYAVPILCEETDRADNNYGEGTVLGTIPGDLDGDGDVDPDDFNIFAGAYGTSVGDPAYEAEADLDNNGDIDPDDFNIFAAKYGLSI